MKQLLYFFFFSSFFFPFFSQSQDLAFTLRGKLQQPSSINSFVIFYPKMHMDSFLIKADGSFLYSGNFSEPGEVQIGTRKSSIKIWLDTNLKYIYLTEKPNQNGKIVLTVDSVIGSEDTYLYYYTLLPKSREIIRTTINRSFYSQKEIEAFNDSLSKANKPVIDSLHKAIFFREVDSIFKIRPNSKVLPWLIRFYAPNLGIDVMQEFYYRLTTEQQNSKSGIDLLKELNKRQLLKPGTYFEDFTMNDSKDRKFYFSSLQDKYVLIDFWASWCSPCRVNHPGLREVYLKNKQYEFEIVGVSLDDDKQKWIQAIQDDGLNWINVSDLKGRNNVLAMKYKITGIPFSVLLDKKGRIVLINPLPGEIDTFFKNSHQ